MPESGWNVQGWIGLPLERKARELLEIPDTEIRNTIFSADSIVAGTFVEVMFILLRAKHGISTIYSEFAQACQPFFGTTLRNEDKEYLCSLFDTFYTLLNQQPES